MVEQELHPWDRRDPRRSRRSGLRQPEEGEEPAAVEEFQARLFDEALLATTAEQYWFGFTILGLGAQRGHWPARPTR